MTAYVQAIIELGAQAVSVFTLMPGPDAQGTRIKVFEQEARGEIGRIRRVLLYSLFAAQQKAGTACDASNTTTPPASTCVFNDVTSGNNSVPGEMGYPSGVYAAAAGYDLASGLGSVNIENLVGAWKNATSLPP